MEQDDAGDEEDEDDGVHTQVTFYVYSLHESIATRMLGIGNMNRTKLIMYLRIV
jgi:hypothetical protein